jgi:DNA-binding NarL/FixJ family response regulator
MAVIRVLIADDEQLMRHALTLFVDAEPDMTVVGTATCGPEAVHEARQLEPDIVLMDLRMPGGDGIAATAEIHAQVPRCRTITLTTFGTLDGILAALRAGASGYLLKDSDPTDVVGAIRAVHEGSGFLSPRIAERLIASVRDSPDPVGETSPPPPELSTRETEVVLELGKGRSNAEIAAALHLSESSVKGYLAAVMAKWGARDRVQVLIRAAHAGIVRL